LPGRRRAPLQLHWWLFLARQAREAPGHLQDNPPKSREKPEVHIENQQPRRGRERNRGCVGVPGAGAFPWQGRLPNTCHQRGSNLRTTAVA